MLPKHKVKEEGDKKKRRWRPGTVALREIRKYQKAHGFLVPRQRLNRLVREILGDYGNWRITKDALLALQDESETMLVETFAAAQTLSCLFKKRTCVKEAYVAVTSGEMVVNGISTHPTKSAAVTAGLSDDGSDSGSVLHEV